MASVKNAESSGVLEKKGWGGFQSWDPATGVEIREVLERCQQSWTAGRGRQGNRGSEGRGPGRVQ